MTGSEPPNVKPLLPINDGGAFIAIERAVRHS